MKENYDSKHERSLEDEARKHKEQDERMKYGKNFQDFQRDTLRPGEVKRYNKVKKKWVSNKD